MEDIPPVLIINWDQTGLKIVPGSTWTFDRKGKRRVEVVGTSDKRKITVLCGTVLGDFFYNQIV